MAPAALARATPPRTDLARAILARALAGGLCRLGAVIETTSREAAMPGVETALVLKVCNLIRALVKQCEQTCEFTHQLSTLAMHMKINVLDALEDNSLLKTPKPAIEKTLARYQDRETN